jgi:hypothetical protein
MFHVAEDMGFHFTHMHKTCTIDTYSLSLHNNICVAREMRAPNAVPGTYHTYYWEHLHIFAHVQL